MSCWVVKLRSYSGSEMKNWPKVSSVKIALTRSFVIAGLGEQHRHLRPDREVVVLRVVLLDRDRAGPVREVIDPSVTPGS